MNFIAILIITAIAALLVYTPNKISSSDQQSSIQAKIPDAIDTFFTETLNLDNLGTTDSVSLQSLSRLGMAYCTSNSQCATTYPNNQNVKCVENYCYGI